MGIKEVLLHPAPILLTPSASIQIEEDNTAQIAEISALVQDLTDTMIAAEGVGLAAPQIGVLQRVIVYRTNYGIVHLINPEIVAFSGYVRSFDEGCLSCPDFWVDVRRKKEIVVHGYTVKAGKIVEFREKVRDKTTSFRIQHEVDHLDGITIKERARK